MLSANAAVRHSAVSGTRHIWTTARMASSSRHLLSASSSELAARSVTHHECNITHDTLGSRSVLRPINRAFATAQPRRASSSTTSPEPAVSRPLDTPPNPIPPLGNLKSIGDDYKASTHNKSKMKDEHKDPTVSLHTTRAQTPNDSQSVREKDEACQTLSPSSPSSPRSQGKQPDSIDYNSQPQRMAATADDVKQESGKAIPPEIVNKPSIGRKGSASKFKAQKAALTLTAEAVERVRSLLDASGGPKLLRIGVRNKGCAGMSYHLEYVTPEQAGKFDERVKQDGVEVLIDSKALFSIIGSEMDWQEDRLSAKFVFNNPNVIEACGCGESVRFG